MFGDPLDPSNTTLILMRAASVISSGICSALGEYHYVTFDNEHYDFQSMCEYEFVSSMAGEFKITIQNHPCGYSERACAKHLTIKIKTGESYTKIEILQGMGLKVNGELYETNKYRDDDVEIRPFGSLWIVVYVPSLGLTVIFDFGKYIAI